jgi:hypothetical protein
MQYTAETNALRMFQKHAISTIPSQLSVLPLRPLVAIMSTCVCVPARPCEAVASSGEENSSCGSATPLLQFMQDHLGPGKPLAADVWPSASSEPCMHCHATRTACCGELGFPAAAAMHSGRRQVQLASSAEARWRSPLSNARQAARRATCSVAVQLPPGLTRLSSYRRCPGPGPGPGPGPRPSPAPPPRPPIPTPNPPTRSTPGQRSPA